MVYWCVECFWVIFFRLCFLFLYVFIYWEVLMGCWILNFWFDFCYMMVVDFVGCLVVSKIWRFLLFNLYFKDNKIILSMISIVYLIVNIVWLKLIIRVGMDRGIIFGSLFVNYEYIIIMFDIFYYFWNMEFYWFWFGVFIGED